MTTREDAWKQAADLTNYTKAITDAALAAATTDLANWLIEGSEGPSETEEAQRAIDARGDDDSAPEVPPGPDAKGYRPLHRRNRGEYEFAYVIDADRLAWLNRAEVRRLTDDEGRSVVLLHI